MASSSRSVARRFMVISRVAIYIRVSTSKQDTGNQRRELEVVATRFEHPPGLHEKGVGLFLHQQGLDTTTTAGKAMFQMLGVFAEFERGIIRERVNAGLARARANGTKLGRRRVEPKVEAKIL